MPRAEASRSDLIALMRPLEHLIILDFSTLLPGPLATLLLAEAGAEVIKIEKPGAGDDMRHYEPRVDGESAIFALLNRGKKSLALDLKSANDRQRLQPLLERADVIVEQFRPGVMARLGLGYAEVAAINPRIIYCSISAYGQTGPRHASAAHDLNLQAECGQLALSMGDAEDVALPPVPIADIAGGSYPAVINILLALQQRTLTGRGQYIDLALADGLFTLSYWALATGWATGTWPGNRDSLVTGVSPRYQVYATRDGKAIAAAPLEQKFWDVFCDAIGLEEALRDDASDPRATLTRVAQIIGGSDAAYWAEQLVAKGCCCTLVSSLATAVADPQFAARGLFDHAIVNAHGRRMPALPVPLIRTFRASVADPLGVPTLGQDNDLL